MKVLSSFQETVVKIVFILILIDLFNAIAKTVNQFTSEVLWAGRVVVFAVGLGMIHFTAKELGVV